MCLFYNLSHFIKVPKYFLKIATFFARLFLKKRVARIVGKVAKLATLISTVVHVFGFFNNIFLLSKSPLKMFIIAATQFSGYQHTRDGFSQRGLLNIRQVNEDIIHIIMNIEQH